jgi:hypothetical protein
MFAARQGFFSQQSVGPTSSYYLNSVSYYDPVSGGNSIYVADSTFSSTNQTILVGQQVLAGASGDGTIIKTNQYGTITNQISLRSSANACQMYVPMFDSTGNLYVAGSYSTVGPGTDNQAVLIKLDSSLNITWQNTLSGATSEDWYVGTINTNTDTIYVGGRTGASGNIPLLASYDTSGSLLFQKQVSTADQRIEGISYDSSNNYYVVAVEKAATGVQGIQIFKWNSSNTFQWSLRMYGAVDIDFSNSNLTNIVVDTSGNLYIPVIINSVAYITKFNSSGTLQWQKSFSGTYEKVTGMTIDSSNNIYFSLNDGSGGNYIIKMNSSGTIVWQNVLYSLSYFFGSGNSVTWKNNTLLIGLLSVSAPRNTYMWSLPDDGSLTGTYGGFTYASSSLTTSTSSLTTASVSDTSSSTSLSTGTGALTSSAGIATQSITTV